MTSLKIALVIAACLLPRRIASPGPSSGGSVLEIRSLRTEYLENPLGLDRPQPRFTWEVSAATERAVQQASYRILVGGSGSPDGSTWDSGVVASAKSFQVKYGGPKLASATVYHWAVTVTTTSSVTAASSVASFSMGILSAEDWGGAEFIRKPGNDTLACPWFRKGFLLPANATGDALLYLGSVGYHELSVNGQPASQGVLLPSISYLPKRALYRTYNISSLLQPGKENVIGVWAAAGWANFRNLDFGLSQAAPLVLARLQVGDFSVISDGTWKAIIGWDTVNTDASAWESVLTHSRTELPQVSISADAMEPTVRHSTVPAKTISPNSTAGSWLVEFDELFTGWFELSNMHGTPGSTVSFKVSTTEGLPMEYGMEDSYTFGPSGKGKFRMRFAYHEIEYLTISGLLSPPSTSDIVGYRLTSLAKRTGSFACSSTLLTRIYDTTVNNYRGLTTGGMTVDCPHRERKGYGGDGHTSYQFALANFPVGAYFSKWMRDFKDTQGAPSKWMPACTTPGSCWVPNTAPNVEGGGGPAWSGFIVTNPWQTYNTYGDTDILRDNYPAMQSLLSFYANATREEDGLLHPWGKSTWLFLGDWITPHGSESNVTSPENILFNNAYLHYITVLAAKISAVLGFDDRAQKYHAAASKLAAAVTARFANSSSGVYLDMLQTHSVMPLASGLVPAALANKTMANLAHAITVTNKGHLDTGLTGTYFMTKFLMESGRNDLIFTFANQTTFPSYGFFLERGFTTWPEDWKAGLGVSKMHGCFNAIGLWFVEGIAGIRVHVSEDPPLTIRAGVDAGDVSWANGSRAAPHGQTRSSWTLGPHGFSHNVSIPGNAKAKVLIPSRSGVSGVMESGIPAATAKGVSVLGQETINRVDYVALVVLSGEYRFASSWTREPTSRNVPPCSAGIPA